MFQFVGTHVGPYLSSSTQRHRSAWVGFRREAVGWQGTGRPQEGQCMRWAMATAGQARLAHACMVARASLTWPGLAGAMRAPRRTLGRACIRVARRLCNRVHASAQQGRRSWEEWFKWAPVHVMGRGDMLRRLRPAGSSRPSAVRIRMCADSLSLTRSGNQYPCTCRAIRSVCSALAYAAPAPAYLHQISCAAPLKCLQ